MAYCELPQQGDINYQLGLLSIIARFYEPVVHVVMNVPHLYAVAYRFATIYVSHWNFWLPHFCWIEGTGLPHILTGICPTIGRFGANYRFLSPWLDREFNSRSGEDGLAHSTVSSTPGQVSLTRPNLGATPPTKVIDHPPSCPEFNPRPPGVPPQ